MRRLVLLRHGETDWNAAGRLQGHADVALNEAGLAQAIAVAPHLAKYQPVAIWTSDLARAARTAEIIADMCDVEVRRDVRLREISVGAAEGLTWAEIEESYPGYRVADGPRDHTRVPGAESVAALAARMTEVLVEALGQLDAGETVLVVSHGGAAVAGLAGLLGWPAEAARSIQGLANCGWAIVEEVDGRLRLGAYNRVAEG
ncbi:histidine phosphatase family protein [Nocardioides limicola]|uniref:histidine phosphatase family protein n=1 Tax=Nocardioides limicola TaxID=2803368 RepID=UPI001EF15C58|nr:histidine phosphatase family protein [Nocardioides sp. DJM-14]